MLTVFLILSMWQLSPSTLAQDWSYEKGDQSADDWATAYEGCRGKRQSPIAFWDNDVSVNQSLDSITFIEYDANLRATIHNNGHTIVMTFPPKVQAKIRGGLLPEDYRLVQMHVHWGATNTLGSEHMFGNDHYPLEMHLVHVRGTKTLDEALNDPQGLAVLGVFYEISSEKDNALTPITNIMDSIKFKGNNVTVSEINLQSLLPHDTSNFFTYYGSLTTPPCSEVVIWTVFSETHPISVDQLRSFRNVNINTAEKDILGETDIGNKLLFNHRPTQPLNDRPVYARRHKVGLVKRCFSAASTLPIPFLAPAMLYGRL